MSGGLTIEVEHLQRGQPQSYAPHTYESRITLTGRKSWDLPHESRMKDLVQVLVHPFTEDPPDGSMDSHFRPRLKLLERQGEREALTDEQFGPVREVWLARVECPFCD